MVQIQIERHEATSERFLRHADDWYERGDLPQASEKAWGAVAHYLKSVANSRGWANSSHGNLDEIADDLAVETDDPDRARDLYRSASILHRNFYEDRMSDSMVGWKIEEIIELLALLRNRTKPQPAERPSQQRTTNQSPWIP